MGRYDYDGWKPYVSAAERRRKAERAMKKLRKEGHPLSPVVVQGRAIARTFWGKAWCENLERYSDFSNRLPRGRTYVRNGSVVDLQIAPGEVSALVSGSDIYTVRVEVAAVPKTRWTAICRDCEGAIDSLVELLQGRFSTGVMERICRQKTGLFPTSREITFSCSCPDWAAMCKHVAAVLYGIGARLDHEPELLFKLRKVNGEDLIVTAGKGLPLSMKGPAKERILAADGLSELFGLDIGTSVEEPIPEAAPAAKKSRSRAAAKPKSRSAAKKATPRSAAKPKPRSDSAAVAGPEKTPRRPAAGSKAKTPKTHPRTPDTQPKTRG